MNNASNLETFKESGLNWYESYSGTLDSSKTILVITPTVYPNVLQGDKSIYSRRFVFDNTISVVQNYYQELGIKSIVSGPSGLGAVGGLTFGLIISWLIAHKELLRLLPLIFSIAKKLFQKYKLHKSNKELAVLRSTRFRVRLDLSIYIDEGDKAEDLVPYLQQMVASVKGLAEKLEFNVANTTQYINVGIYDLQSDEHISASLLNNSSPAVLARVINKLKKVNASDTDVAIFVKKNKFFTNIKLSRNVL